MESASSVLGPWQPLTGTVVETNGRRGVRTELLRTERRGEAVPVDAVNFSPNSRDGLSLFFSSNRPSPGRPSGLNNIWVARRTALGEPFGEPLSLGAAFQEFEGMLDPHISADGRTLYFNSLGQLSNPAPFGDIWQVPVATAVEPSRYFMLRPGFGAAELLSAPDPVGARGSRDRGPSFSGDGLSLFLCSDVSGDMDLWITTRADSSDSSGWAEPVPLGNLVNSSFADWSPNLSRDGLVLYFSSDRPGMGRSSVPNNIWVARPRSVTEPFGSPVNLEPHFLPVGNMLDPCLAPDGSTLVFATHGLLADPFPREFVDLWQAPVVPPPVRAISWGRGASQP